MKYLLLSIALLCLACSDNISSPEEYQEVCEDKELGFHEVQYDPYHDQYYEEWLTKA